MSNVLTLTYSNPVTNPVGEMSNALTITYPNRYPVDERSELAAGCSGKLRQQLHGYEMSVV